MQISRSSRCLLLLVLLVGTCVLVTYGKGGRGGGSRGGSRTSSRSRQTSTRYRPTSRPAPSYTNRPAPAPTHRPAPAPTSRPAPASPRPPSAASPKPPAPNEAVIAKQPAQNPNFKETNANQGASNPQQPAHNPNYKPDGSPGGAPPPYSPGGQPVPSAPVGPPPPYGSPGQRPPYAPSGPGQAPPPYPGNPGYPPAYPGLPPRPGQPGGYPNQPGSYPNQPGSYPNQPGVNRPYPVQPGSQPGGYPNQPGGNRPYPVQPGSYPNQPGGFPNQPNRPYPVQPGSYPGGFPGGRPYPQQPLGGNVWQPQSGRPAPAYMNYGGLPTGTNMYTKPHKQKGFLGSLMSTGGSKHDKKNKYYGSYPSPYGMGNMGGGKYGQMGGGMGGMGRTGSFLGRHKTAAMFTILPIMALGAGAMLFRPRFSYMPYYSPMPHFYHQQGYYGGGGRMDPRYTHYYDIQSDDYVGKCQRPLKRDHSEMKCKSDYNQLECQSKCEDGYKFDNKLEVQAHKCWHITGVWRPTKNFPECIPICQEECENGGKCIRPGVCGCEAEYRGDHCQFRKLNFLNCDARHIIQKGDLQVGFVCSHAKNETTCKIHCKEPAVFETPSTNEFKCTPEGKWTPDSVPRCIIKDAEKAEKATETA